MLELELLKLCADDQNISEDLKNKINAFLESKKIRQDETGREL